MVETKGSFEKGIEMSQKVFAVGDIHGHPRTLEALLKKMEEHVLSGDIIVFLGDYLDKGPNSPGVLNLLLRFKEKMSQDKVKTVFLAGNHESIWLGVLSEQGLIDKSKLKYEFMVGDWSPALPLQNGIIETFYQFGSNAIINKTARISKDGIEGAFSLTPPRLKQAQIDFFYSLEPFFHWKNPSGGMNLLFVHADVHSDALSENSSLEAIRKSVVKDSCSNGARHMFWSRDNLHTAPAFCSEATIVHGHSPLIRVVEVYQQKYLAEEDPSTIKSYQDFLKRYQDFYLANHPVLAQGRINLDTGIICRENAGAISAAMFVDGELSKIFKQNDIDS